MNPDVFFTIVFSSFVFFVGVAGVLFVTMTVVRGRRPADASLNPPSDGAEASSRQPVAVPVTLHSASPVVRAVWRS